MFVVHCVEGCRILERFPALFCCGEKVLFGGGVVGDEGAVGAGDVGDQFEIAAPVEVGVRLREEEFGGSDDVRMWGCPGDSGMGVLMTGRGGVVIAVAARAAHQSAASTTRAVRERPDTTGSAAVIEKSRTRGCGA